jgi:putative two-component system response regulator
MTDVPRRPKVLVVDDDQTIRRVIVQLLSKDEAYDLYQASNGTEGLQVTTDVRPDLIISDYLMPGIDGFELCRLVKQNPELSSTVFILLTMSTDVNKKIEGLSYGADDFVEKSQPSAVLMGKVKAFLRMKVLQNELQEEKQKLALANEVLERNFKELISILLKIVETIVPGTSGRAKISKAIAEHLADRFSLGEEEKKNIVASATLHEIGKAGLPERVKEKSYESLQGTEKTIFQQHPAIGSMIISSISGFRNAANDVSHQLENYDGSGTPDGLRGEEISLGARILRAIVFQEELFMTGSSTADTVREMKSSMNKVLDPMVASEVTEFLIQHDADFSHDKEKVAIEDLKSGMVVAEDVYSVNGIKLLPMGTKLQDRILQLILDRSLTDPVIGGVYVYKS